MSRFDVQHRDAFDSLAAMRNAGGADLVLTSPPYPNARSDAQYGAGFDTSVDGYHRLGLAVFDALRPGGVCALNIDGPVRVWRPELGESERSLISFKVAIDWAESIGFRYVEHAAYVRDGQPGRFGPRWRTGWEPVHVFAKPGAEPHFDASAYMVPARNAGKREHRRQNRAHGRDPGGFEGWWSTPDERQLSTALAVTVSRHNSDNDHPAPFARQLADAYVLCYAPPNGLVGDPFVGSGTVALACHRHDRRFIGGDLGHRERDGRRWADIVNEQLSQGTLFAEATCP